jgi:hypothetical protein
MTGSLGYEQCDTRLSRLARSRPAWLTSAYPNCSSPHTCPVFPRLGQFRRVAFGGTAGGVTGDDSVRCLGNSLTAHVNQATVIKRG